MPSADVVHVCFGGLGGHLSVVNTLSRELARVGISSGVVAVAPPEALVSTEDSWVDAAFVQRIPVRRRADVASMRAAFLAGRRIDARIVMLHTLRHATPLALGRLTTRRPLHLVTRESHSLPSRTWTANVLSASSLLWSEAVVFLTAENMAGYPLRSLPLRALRERRVIPNGVDVSRFRVRTRDLGQHSGPVTVGMAARFVPGKDFSGLVEAIGRLQAVDDVEGPRLLLAGDGPTRHDIQDHVDALGLGHVVTLLGHVPEAEMPAFLDRLDVYVQATDGEAFSMSLIQACAAGLPIVASAVPGVVDVFTDRVDALLVAPRDPDALAAAVAELSLPGSRLALDIAERAHDLGVSTYSATRMADSYLALFADLDPTGPWTAARVALAP